MGFLGSLMKGLAGSQELIASSIGAVTTAIQNRKNREWNAEQAELNREFQSAEAEKSRVFNSNEAALQRDWSAAEAERARDWNEEMYAKYNSLSGKIAQAEQAGVNPMLAITGNAVSPMAASSSVPSGVSASSGSPSGATATSSFVDIVGSMLGMGKLKAEIDNIEADTDQKKTESYTQLAKLASEIRSMDSLSDLNVQKALESVQNIDNLKSQLKLTDAQASMVQDQINYLNAQANYINSIREPDTRKRMADAEISEWMNKNKQLFKSLDVGLEAAQVISDIGIGIFNARTGANAPFVVPKDGQVYFPSDIVH